MLRQLMDNPIFFRESRVVKATKGVRFHKILNAIIYPLMYAIPPMFILLTYIMSGHIDHFYRDLTNILKGCFYFSAGVQFFYILISSLNGTQGAFTREKEQKTYDSLIATLMTLVEIYRGKYLSAMYPALLSLMAYSPLFILMGLAVRCTLSGLLTVLVFSLALALFSGAAGLFASLFSKDTRGSQTIVTGIYAALIMGTGLLDFLAYAGYRSLFHHGSFFPLFSSFNIGAGYVSALYSMDGRHSPQDSFFYFWVPSLFFMGLFSIIMYHFSIKKLREIPGE